MGRLNEIQNLKAEIYRIAGKYHAGTVYVFGSCARREDTPDSDVDLLVDFTPDATLFDQVDIQEEMQQLLNCKVDVVSKRGLHPYIRNRVLNEAVAI